MSGERPGPGPEFLKGKYGLQASEEVASAVRRAETRTGEEISGSPEARIQTYLDRFSEVASRPEPDKRDRGIRAIKQVLYERYVIKSDQIPESYFALQKRIAREQGHGDRELSAEERLQHAEAIADEQRASLDTWIDYLAMEDAPYPDWLKYYALRNVLEMGEYDTRKHAFAKRSASTTRPFPELNREALAFVLDTLERSYTGKDINLESVAEHDQQRLKMLLAQENFSKLYAWALEAVTPAAQERLSVTAGAWVKYEQNSDPKALVHSIKGRRTGWCTAGESTARRQLKGGDFYVYYSQDLSGSPSVPRAAIRMLGNHIAEVRGIAKEQNLDTYITDLVEQKIREFPNGPVYERRVRDMQQLTAVEHKMKAGQVLQREDLLVLYEVERPLQGFGYRRDPRIQELRSKRDAAADVPLVFNCSAEQVARGPSEVTDRTKVYVGPLLPGTFEALRAHGVERVFRAFPEQPIRRVSLTVGGGSARGLLRELTDRELMVSEDARAILTSKSYKVGKKSRTVELVRLPVASLDLGETATLQKAYRHAATLGWEPCDADVGPYLRLAATEEPLNQWLYVGMQPVVGSDGVPRVLELVSHWDGDWLLGRPARSTTTLSPDREIVLQVAR